MPKLRAKKYGSLKNEGLRVCIISKKDSIPKKIDIPENPTNHLCKCQESFIFSHRLSIKFFSVSCIVTGIILNNMSDGMV